MATRKWTKEQKAKQSEALKQAWVRRKQEDETKRLIEDVNARHMEEAWNLWRCKRVLRIGKLRILWG